MKIAADRYVVYPTGYDGFVNSDKGSWCLTIVNGHAWGWSIRHGLGGDSGLAMNRKGEWIWEWESRGHGGNKRRRWPLEEAIEIAKRHVDTHRLNGCTAKEASDSVAARSAQREASGE